MATAAIRRGLLLSTANRPQEALVMLEWAVALGERHHLDRQATLAHLNAGDICLQDDIPGAIEHSEAAIEGARRIGERSYETVSVGNMAMRHILGGRWDVAEQLCRGLLDSPRAPAAGSHLNALLTLMASARGDVQEAKHRLSMVEEWRDSEDIQSRGNYQAVATAVAIADGDAASVLEASDAVLREVATAMGLRCDPFRLLWPATVAATLDLGRLDQAESLMALVEGRPVGNVPTFLQAQLARFRARLDAAEGKDGEVEANFATAERLLRDLDYAYWLACVQLDHAGWLVANGRTEDAALLLAEATPTFEQLGAAPAVDRCRELLATVGSPVSLGAG